MRKKEKRDWGTAYATPLDAMYTVEIGGTEGKGTPVEQDATTAFVHFPQPATVGTILAPIQQVAMLIYPSELQYTVLIDDEFLIHGSFFSEFYSKDSLFIG